MKKIIVRLGLLAGIALLVLFIIESVKDTPRTILGVLPLSPAETRLQEPAPREGETLRYLIKYLWIIPVGTAEIEVGDRDTYNKRRVYPLIATAATSALVSQFVKAEGTIQSLVDSQRYYPWRYEEKAQAEGHSPEHKIITYDQHAQIMQFEDIKRKIPKNTQDPLSALFFLRWQQYQAGEDITLNVNSNQENYTLLTQLTARREIPLSREKGKSVKIIVTDSVIKSPKRYSKSEATITTFMLDDARRIPFLMKVKTKFGPLVVRLTGAEYR